jgi:hypothetical protein
VRKYCKAYRLGELRRFPGWPEPESGDRTDDSIVYVWDDLTVVDNPMQAGDPPLLDTVNEEWARFCRDELAFEIPGELRND